MIISINNNKATRLSVVRGERAPQDLRMKVLRELKFSSPLKYFYEELRSINESTPRA